MSEQINPNVKEKRLKKIPTDEDGKLYMGFIFHVGLYSFFAYDDIISARKRNIQNGSEWYYQRLMGESRFSKNTINKTQLYHKTFGDDCDYFKAPFYITRESIGNWLDLCVRCKARYAIITAKHHDGFCLWPTQTSNPKSSLDVVQIFKEECLKRDLLFGIYYSWYEFSNSMTIKFFNEVCIPQINELLQYSPTFFWFDGDWVITQKAIISKLREIVIYIKSLGIYINDRISRELIEMGSYSVGGLEGKTCDRAHPKEYRLNWQHINTIGISWGYNKMQTPNLYKDGKDLMCMYLDTVNLGGSFLLNLGPKHDGTLDENEVNSIEEFIEILNTKYYIKN